MNDKPVLNPREVVNDTLEQVRTILSVKQAELQEIIPKLVIAFHEAAKRMHLVEAVLLELEWPSHGDLDLIDARYILDAYCERGLSSKEDIERYLVSRYDETILRAMLNEWETQAWLRKRLPILREAVESHISGKYWVSIPAMLPQVEGIIIERYGHTGYFRYEYIRRYLEELLSNNKPGRLIHPQIIGFYANVFAAQFVHGQVVSASLSRHAILHGADTQYGTRANSLKAILLFDQLQRDIRRCVSLKQGRCYHEVGCASVSLTRPDLTFYKSFVDAEIAGLRPCKVCKPPTIR